MKNIEWHSFFYNGIETNIEVTKCGRVRKVPKDWYGKGTGSYKIKYGEFDFTKLKLNLDGYIQIGIKVKGLNKKTVSIHQLVASVFLDYKFGMFPKFVVMHLDDNPLNNNLSNLKVDTHRENMSQARTKKSGLPVGVSFCKKTKKFISRIFINDKTIHLGYYNTPEEASQVYQNKLKEISIHKNN